MSALVQNYKHQKHKIKSSFVVINAKGLHTRPSTELVKCSTRFKAKISLTYNRTTVNGKSLLGVLMLAAAQGAKVTIEAEGEDAQEAVKALIQLAENEFHMQY